jgi:leucyl aminopeptidase
MPPVSGRDLKEALTMTVLSAPLPSVPVIPIEALYESDLATVLARHVGMAQAFAEASGFKARSGDLLIVPGGDGAIAAVLFGLGAAPRAGRSGDPMAFRALPSKLPAGQYQITAAPADMGPEDLALAWLLGTYRFDRYKSAGGSASPKPQLVVEDGIDIAAVQSIAEACALARDMINTPANDMGPADIEAIARTLAKTYGATIAVITGQDLLTQNYPAVHAVGRAADPARAPRMIEMAWGDETHPLICLVGKGVVFDTGGLDIKPSAGMRLMKKDMGGAAHALALAQMIMTARLPVRLVVLTPVVENAISGDAMRPSDVLASRKGLSIEVGNTDAEGRLVLADALTRACELNPVLTVDLATLTGAARVALGPSVIPFFTDDEALARDMADASLRTFDPLWRLPLWAGYGPALDSDIADIKNDPDGWAQAGSVTAALFLQRFAPAGSWVHLDIYAWNPRNRPGFPGGGEAQAIRALFAMIAARYS